MDDASVYMPAILVVGLGLRLKYGIRLGDISIIFWNVIAAVLNTFIISMKLRYGRQEKNLERLIDR